MGKDHKYRSGLLLFRSQSLISLSSIWDLNQYERVILPAILYKWDFVPQIRVYLDLMGKKEYGGGHIYAVKS